MLGFPHLIKQVESRGKYISASVLGLFNAYADHITAPAPDFPNFGYMSNSVECILWLLWRVSLIRLVLVRVIGFSSSLVTHSLVITRTHREYSAISVVHQLQFTVAHALWRTMALIHALCSSLQHVLSLLSLPCLHQSLPGDGSRQRPLFPWSDSSRLTNVSQWTKL
jgi:hypothetical protein